MKEGARNGYDFEKLSKVIGDQKNVKLFRSEEEYKNFIISFLQNTNGKFNYSDEFLQSLQRRGYYHIEENFSSEELGEIAFNNFKFAISKYEKLNDDIWRLLWNCRTRSVKDHNANEQRVNSLDNPAAIRVFRDFVKNKDMDGFLKSSITQQSFDELFKIEGVINTIYKNIPLFIRYLQFYKGPSQYKSEFLKLYDTLKNNSRFKGGVPLSFFKVIPIKLREETRP